MAFLDSTRDVPASPLADGQVPGIVPAETWAALRGGPWHLDPATVEQSLAPLVAG